MSPTSARLMDEVVTEQTRVRDAAIAAMRDLSEMNRMGLGFLSGERQCVNLQTRIIRAEEIMLALRAARVRSFFLGRSDEPFEGSC